MPFSSDGFPDDMATLLSSSSSCHINLFRVLHDSFGSGFCCFAAAYLLLLHFGHDPRALQNLQIMFGYNHCEGNAFADPHLDVNLIGIFAYHWMHVYFVVAST